MREIAPFVAARCSLVVPALDAGNDPNQRLGLLFKILAENFKSKWIEPKSLCMWLQSCKRNRLIWSFSPIWLNYLGFQLRNSVVEPFSPLLLFIELTKASNAIEIQREMLPGLGELTTPVSLSSGATAKLEPLVVNFSDKDSLDFWYSNLAKLASISSYPTTTQAEELVQNLNLLILERKESPDDIAATIACSSPNKIMGCVAANILLKRSCEKGAPANVVPLLLDFKCILYFVGLSLGVNVEDLKADKWKMKGSVSNQLRKTVVLAMSKMSWVQLFDAFKFEGLTKCVFKAIHIHSLLYPSQKNKDKSAKYASSEHPKLSSLTDEARNRLGLLQAMLREKKYPATEADFVSWHEHVVVPLTELSKNRLFIIDECWLQSAFDPALVGKSLTKPILRIASTVLAMHGNTAKSWDRIFDDKLLTPGQVLNSIRSLILLGIPADKALQPIIDANKSPQTRVPTMNILKIHCFIKKNFSADKVEFIMKQVTPDTEQEGIAKLPNTLFRDKNGSVYELEKKRRVNLSLGPGIVADYLRVLEKILLDRMTESQPKTKGRAVISFTPSLLNCVRSGLPPVVPTYSPVSMWRNESLCLQQILPGTGVEKLTAGVTWCQTKGSASVDLDLSIMMLDEQWKLVDHCSYTQLNTQGAVHSGDLRSAPYPTGAREMVELDLKVLRERKISKILICVFSFTGQDMSFLDDSSVFIANPLKPGTGPGSMDIIAAARLTGQGTLNVAAYIDFKDDVLTFVNVDQTLNVKSRSVTDCPWLGAMVQRINRANDQAPNVRLYQLASFYSAIIAEEVLLISQSGLSTPITRRPDESIFDYYIRLMQAVEAVKPCVEPKPKYHAVPLNGQALTLFGGELDSWVDVAEANDALACNSEATLRLVNLASAVKACEVKSTKEDNSTKITVVSGWDIAEYL